MTLAQRVRDYRYSKGWGPDELASRAAISRTALYQIESGKTELPRAGTLRRIAMALDVSMEALLGHDGSKPAGSTGAAQPSRGTRALLRVVSRRRGRTDGAYASPRREVRWLRGRRFAVEHVAPLEHGLVMRERDLAVKLHELLASPFGEAVARILEETYRLLPQARVVGN